MHRGFALVLVALCVTGGGARAQLSVELRMEKDTFLVYESVPVEVGIRNFSGRTIQLEDSGERSWLSFIVTDESGSMVPAVGKLQAAEPILIPAGQTVARTVDLLPLYSLRDRGNYRVQATVNASGRSLVSSSTRLTIINGREIWSQTVGLPGAENRPDEYRTYALVARRGERQDLLHVLVRDEQKQIVYGLIPLGGFLTMVEPQVLVDKAGALHVLYQSGPRSFGYVHVDPNARVVAGAAYSDFLSKPQLVASEGDVSVRGGEQTYPRRERVMSDEELNPPPPPPPSPKRHWWWPFGRRKSPPPSQ